MNTIQRKICLLGDFAVGKTSLVRRFVEGRFDDKYLSTIGVKISRAPLTRPYGILNLLVWDLAGSDRLDPNSSYTRNMAGAIIVCDLTRLDTLKTLVRYAHQLRASHSELPLVFVGNKTDLDTQRAIRDHDLQETCAALNGPYVTGSARTGEGVEDIFTQMAQRLEAMPSG